MNKTYYRGDMYFTDFGIGLGSEQMGYRPAVIIQNNTGNMYSSTVRSVYKELHADRETGC